MTTIRLENRDWVIGVDRARHEETVIVPQLIDGMQRQIHVGDVISWRSGGYFSHFLCFGFVISVNREQGNIKAVNQNGNKVTIWRTYLTNILARDGDYSLIPNEYMNKFGM
jgi:hypothetical protein